MSKFCPFVSIADSLYLMAERKAASDAGYYEAVDTMEYAIAERGRSCCVESDCQFWLGRENRKCLIASPH